jgi:azurin
MWARRGNVLGVMKTSTLFAFAILAFLTGCGPKDNSAPTAAPAAGPREIDITAGDTMKFSVTSIEASPGEDLDVVLTNIGTIPVEVMGHNWVLLKAGSDPAAFSTAAAAAKETDYIPPALKDEIIAHIDVLGPRKSGEVRFKAPSVPGTYPFLCSFPAHYFSGMKGTLVVK